MAAAADDRPLTLVLGTATPGGGFGVYGEALAEAVAAADPGLTLDVRATAGSGENVPLLAAGRIDVGLVEGTTVHEAWAGIGRDPVALPAVAAMYASPGMFVVRADSPWRAIADLRGRRVVFGAAGSGLVVLARYVLDGLGLDWKADFDGVLLDKAGDGPPMVLSGAAAALWGGGTGWPGFVAVAAGPSGARFLGLDADDVRRVRLKHPFLRAMTVPVGAYRGLDRAIETVGAWSLVLARADLPEAAGWRLARALHRAEGDLARRLAPARETTAANTLRAVPDRSRLHAGVARYLGEAGISS